MQILFILLVIVGFLAFAIGSIIFMEKQRREQLFAAVNDYAGLDPVELDEESKAAIVRLIRETLPHDSVHNPKPKLLAQNPETGDFISIFSKVRPHANHLISSPSSIFSRTSSGGMRFRIGYKVTHGVLLGRRLEAPVYTTPVFFRVFASSISRNILAKSLQAEAEPETGALGWLKNEAGKGAIANFSRSIRGGERVQTTCEPLNSMFIKTGTPMAGAVPMTEAELIEGAGVEYWEQFENEAVLQAADGWRFAILPGWIMAYRSIRRVQVNDALTVWENCMLV